MRDCVPSNCEPNKPLLPYIYPITYFVIATRKGMNQKVAVGLTEWHCFLELFREVLSGERISKSSLFPYIPCLFVCLSVYLFTYLLTYLHYKERDWEKGLLQHPCHRNDAHMAEVERRHLQQQRLKGKQEGIVTARQGAGQWGPQIHNGLYPKK